MASRRVTALPSTLSRASIRCQRTAFRTGLPRARGYADASNASKTAQKSHVPAIVGGLAGGSLVFLIGYGWYSMSGAKSLVNTLHSVKKAATSTTQKVQDSAPAPSEALKWLRQTTQQYAAFVPGAKWYVDKAFDDMDAIHKKHSSEVDDIVADTYTKLKDTTKKGVSLDTAGEALNVLGDAMNRIMALAGDAAGDLMDNHPQLKERLGGDIDALKSMGEQYGPEARKQVEETWGQVKSIMAGGLSATTIPEIKKLVEEKMGELRKVGDEAFEKGFEKAKPLLEKSPKVKEMIEENKDALKKGDVGTLFKRVQEAVSSGNTEELSKWIDDTVNKAKQGGGGGGSGAGGLSQIMSFLPGGSEIGEKLQKLQDISQKHGKEAQDLLDSTVKEISQVLHQKVQDAEGLASKAKKDV